MSGSEEEHPDIVDVFYRPFVRPTTTKPIAEVQIYG